MEKYYNVKYIFSWIYVSFRFFSDSLNFYIDSLLHIDKCF